MLACRICGKRALFRAGGIAASALLLAATLSGSAKGSALQPRPGGTVVIGVTAVEPVTLNSVVSYFELSPWAGQANLAVLAGAYRVAPNLTYRPWLVTHATARRRPFSITYHIRPKARWSDGVAVSASDFVFTWRSIVAAHPSVYTFYHDITRAHVVDAKTVRFSFRRQVADWRDLFPTVLPRHALAGVDLAKIWLRDLNNRKTGRPIASGPFRLVLWRPGHSMTFERNDRYFGARPHLRSFVFRFLPDVATAAEALQARRVDLVSSQPQPALAALRGSPGVRVRTDRVLSWELLQFNLGQAGGGHPLLRRRFVREAVARAIDRRALVRELYGELAPDLPVLESAILMSQSRWYRPWWARYRHDVRTARRLLERNGCRVASDGIYVCGGRRLVLRLSTTAGNQLRERAVQIIDAALRRAGIDAVIDNVPADVLFQRRHPAGDYDISMFAWGSATPTLSGWEKIFGCANGVDGQQNFQGYCDRTVTRLLRAANTTLDQADQAKLVNRALAHMASELPILPLFQKPAMLVHRESVRGLDPGGSGLLYNVERWWKSSR